MSKKKNFVKASPSLSGSNAEIKRNKSVLENKWFVYLTLSLGILIAYFGAFSNDFVGWDDNAYVYENQDILNQNWGRLIPLFDMFRRACRSLIN